MKKYYSLKEKELTTDRSYSSKFQKIEHYNIKNKKYVYLGGMEENGKLLSFISWELIG